MSENKRRAFRIWSSDRKVKKSVVAATLTELSDKSKQKLGYTDEEIKIVLENDGTQVDDEDYFDFLEHHTILIILRSDEKWESIKKLSGHDETDLTCAGGHRSRIEELALMLKQDFAKLITLATEDLQLLLDAETSELSQLMGSDLDNTGHTQNCCQRVLDDRREIAETKLLVELMAKKAPITQDNNSVEENTDIKRQRLG